MKLKNINKKNAFRILGLLLSVTMMLSITLIQFSSLAERVPGTTIIPTFITADTTCAEADNLVANPGFELDDTAWDPLMTSGYPFSFDTTEMHSGLRSMVNSDNAGWASYDTRQKIADVSPDTQYTFSAWLKLTDNQVGWALPITWGAYDFGVYAGTTKVATYQFDAADEWIQFAFTFNSGSNTSVDLYFQKYVGYMYIDDVYLFESSKAIITPVTDITIGTVCAGPDNLVANPGFELDDATWDTFLNDPVNPFSLSTTRKHSGERSLLNEASAAWSSYDTKDTAAILKPQTNYTFSAWVYMTDNYPDWALPIDWGAYDIRVYAGTTLLKAYHMPVAGQWKQIAFTFNSRANTYLDIAFWNYMANFYMDDIYVFETSKAIYKTAAEVIAVNPELMSAPSSDAADNLITNPGLETAAAAGDWGTFNNNCSQVVNAVNAHTGSSYLSYDSAAGGQTSYVREISGLEKFADYTFSVWLYGDSAGDSSVGLAADAAGTPLVVVPELPEGTSSLLKPPRFDKTWYQVGYTFSTNAATSVFIIVKNGGGVLYADDFYLNVKAKAAKVVPSNGDPSVISDYLFLYSVGPTDAKNLLNTNSGAESAFGASDWGAPQFGGTGAVTRTNETAHGGSYSIKFAATLESPKKRAVRWVAIQKNQEYMFTFWAKATTLNNIHLSLIDASNYLTIKSSQLLADKLAEKKWDPAIAGNPRLMPSGYDNQWHQVTVKFNSGNQEKIGILVTGSNGTMYLDDFNMCLVANAKRPDDPADKGVLCEVIGTAPAKKGCMPDDNLFENFNFEGADTSFWDTVPGYDTSEYIISDTGVTAQNKVFKYLGAGDPDYSHYIKWIDVEPNTDYTFSGYSRGIKTGGVVFGLLDSNSSGAQEIGVEMNPEWDNKWHQFAFTFNSNLYSKVGFYVCNAGGEAVFDNLRLFELSNATNLSANDQPAAIITPTPPPATPTAVPTEPEDNENPSTMDNGNFDFPAIIVILFAATLTLIIFMVRKQKRSNI